MAFDLTSITNTISSLRSDALTTLDTLAAFRPTYYEPTPLVAPTLDELATVDAASIADVAVTPTTIVGNPAVAAYVPLAAEALPAGPVVPVYDTSTADALVASFNGLQDTLYAALETTVDGILNTGGITTPMQAAAFAISSERALQIAQDGMDLTGARTGAKGFRFPNSMTSALQAEITLNHTWQRADADREIVRQMALLAQQNIQQALQAGVSINDAKVRVYSAGLDAINGAHRLALDHFRTALQANMQEFEQVVQLQLADLGVQRADRDEMRAYIAARAAQVELEHKVAVAEFEANAKAEFMRVETDRMISELTNSKNEQAIRLFAAEVQQRVEIQRSSISQAQTANAIIVENLQHIATTYTNMMNALSAQGVAVDITRT